MMKTEQFIVGEYYRIETISHLLIAQFNGQHIGQYQFVLVDENQDPIGVVLEFTEEELAYSMIRPERHSELA